MPCDRSGIAVGLRGMLAAAVVRHSDPALFDAVHV